MTDTRWEHYLFARHSRSELAQWAGTLKHFRYCRAYGGHANDGDRLLVALRAETEDELLAVFSILGIAMVRQPGHVRLAGAKVFAWVHPGRLELSISDDEDIYEVTPEAVRAALAVERLIALLEDRLIDPPQDDRHCLAPKYYPELWAARASERG